MEVGDETQPWYVDAWAVHDGKVFASRRRPGSIDAQTTVFMSVPDLQAVPVGRISTALRATRSGFQQGFRDAEGQEVPFASLAPLRGLVSRAYLAAGLGPEAPGAVAGALPRPDAGPGAGTALLELVWGRDEPPALESDGDRLPETPWDGLDRAVGVFAAAAVLEHDAQLMHGSAPGLVRSLVGFVETMLGAGLVPGVLFDDVQPAVPWPVAVRRYAEAHGAHGLAHACWDVENAFPESSLTALWAGDGTPVVTHRGDLPGTWSRSDLAVVPGPRVPGWSWRTTRLVEQALLPLVDRRFWVGGGTVADLAPALTVAVCKGGRRYGRLTGEPSPVAAAYERLRPRLVPEPLPEAAELAVEAFVDGCLAGTVGGRPDAGARGLSPG